MPRQIESLSKRSGRPATYDWDTILSADTPLAYEQGEDFDCKDDSFMNQIRSQATAQGVKVSLRNPEPGVVEVEVLGDDA